MGRNYKYKFATKEDKKFNDFLNKTIVGTSYNFFNRWKRHNERNKPYVEENIIIESPSELGVFEEKKYGYLNRALKSLTNKERLVIYFAFEKDLRGTEIADKLNLNVNTIYKMKKRTLKKLKKRIEEMERNEKY